MMDMDTPHSFRPLQVVQIKKSLEVIQLVFGEINFENCRQFAENNEIEWTTPARFAAMCIHVCETMAENPEARTV